MRQRPLALIGAGLVVDAVIDAGVAQILIGTGKALGELFRTKVLQRLDEGAPDRARIARGVDHLVDDAVDRLVVLQQTVAQRLAAYLLLIPLRHRRSESCRPPEVKGHREIFRGFFVVEHVTRRRMAARLEAGKPPCLRLVAIDREGVVVASARMRDMPFSSTKPRISSLPFSPFSFAQTTKTSAIGALEIHILEPESL